MEEDMRLKFINNILSFIFIIALVPYKMMSYYIYF